jgi:hypothetical protein
MSTSTWQPKTIRARAIPALAIAGCAALTVSGCGTEHAGQATTTKATAPHAATTQAAGASPASSPAQRAAIDSVSLLAAFPAPPGAVRTGPLPVSWLATAPERPAAQDLVTRTAWWRASGPPQAVLAWVRAHIPAGFTLSATGGSGQGPHNVLEPGLPHPGGNTPYLKMWFDEFSRPPVPGVLNSRWLLVAVAADGARQDGTVQTAIRVDSEVAWQPARPAGDRIPGAARVVTIAPVPGASPVSARVQPVTITDPAKVARIAAAVDALPVFPPGRMACRLFRGPAMRLTFRATPAGPVLATAIGDSSGCGTVAVTIDGKPTPTLGQSISMQQQVLSIAGLRWPGYPVRLPDGWQ